MPEAEKKLSTPFSLTKSEHADITKRAQALGMKNASEYLLALHAFDLEHQLRADWNIVPGKARLVLNDIQYLAADGRGGATHDAIAGAAHDDAAVKKTYPRAKAAPKGTAPRK